MNKKILSVLLIILLSLIGLTGCDLASKNHIVANPKTSYEDSIYILKSTKDINLRDVDGKKTNYIFTYKNQDYSAKYTKENWHIKDSYKITNENDIRVICQALIEIYPIHGKDMKSYRTIDDLAYEWQQHNLAYNILPDDNSWKSHAKDVDLNPEDQGKSLEEIYQDRTGKKLDIKSIIGKY